MRATPFGKTLPLTKSSPFPTAIAANDLEVWQRRECRKEGFLEEEEKGLKRRRSRKREKCERDVDECICRCSLLCCINPAFIGGAEGEEILSGPLVSEIRMEDSVRNSDVPEISKKSRSLDLKSLYVEKSNALKEQIEDKGVNRKRRSLPENWEFGSGNGKRRKGRKEVSLSSLETVSGKSAKCSNAADGSKTHGLVLDRRGSTKKKNGEVLGDGNLKCNSTVVSSSLSNNVITVPKRPRDLPRRKRVQNTDFAIQANISFQAQNINVEGQTVSAVSSDGKRKQASDEFKENSSERVNLAPGSKATDGVTVEHHHNVSLKRKRRNRGKKKESRTQDQAHRNDTEPKVGSFSKVFDESKENDEENLEENAARMLSSRFDPSCTAFAGSAVASVSKSMNGFSSVPSVHGEHEVNTSGGSEPNSVDAAGRVLRPRKKGKEKRHVRKRRHFYEIFSRNVDAYWVLNRRIKIFWPLDQCWYFGSVTDYDPQGKLHHVKYDDREEEWIDLQSERFKLLLLRGEVPRKSESEKVSNELLNDEKGDLKVEDDNCVGSFMDSEPIISWLARSSHRVKSSPFCVPKKQKIPSLPKNISSPLPFEDSVVKSSSCLVDDCSRPISSLNYDNVIMQERPADRETVEGNVLESATCSGERKLHSVYFRKRLRRKEHALGVASPDSGCKSFAMSVQSHSSVANSVRDSEEQVSTVQFRYEADTLSVFRTMFLLQNGMVVALWPKVQLEMLFVDNVVGLRFMSFEGCLMQAVAFFCLVLVAFHLPCGDGEFVGEQLPVTSIRLELTGFQDLSRRLVFVFYSFLDIKNSTRLYLVDEIEQYCSVSKRLPLPECTSDNIKIRQSQSNGLSVTSAYGEPVSLEALRKRSRHGIMHMRMTKESANISLGISHSNVDEQHMRLPRFVLSFSAQPTFFLSLHLKLLMDRNVASISSHYPVSVLESAKDSCKLVADDSYDQETFDKDMGCISNLFNSGSELSSFSDSKVEADAPSDTGDGIKSHKGLTDKLNVAETSISLDLGNNENIGIAEQRGHPCHHSAEQGAETPKSSFPADNSSHEKSRTECLSQSHGISVQIPQIDCSEAQGFDGETATTPHSSSELTWNATEGTAHSPNPTAPRSMWHRNKASSASFSFGFRSKMVADGQGDANNNGIYSGSRKPRSQVSYLLPWGDYDFSPRPRSHLRKVRSFKRIRNGSEKLMVEGCRSPQQHTELSSCDVNILITVGDKGWRECGAQVVLECIDHSDWRLMVKLSGTTRYSYKAYQFLQPGTTNRYTHAMMWRGGKDWVLEFTDRSQWTVFKDMHEECYNRNIRAASMKTIPIPGVRLIEESDDNAVEVTFTRNTSKYIRQVGTEVDMALSPSCALYDMDSDDEEWIAKRRTSSVTELGADLEMSEDMFERTMDLFEKVAYVEQRDDFTSDEIEELFSGAGPIDMPPLWEKYQQQLKEWEMALNKTQSLPNGCVEKALPIEKPPMFAFCLRPRGLEVPNNKGSKQRSHRRVTTGTLYAYSRDHEGLQLSGRKSNGFVYGEERVLPGQSYESWYASPWMTSTRALSPRDGVSAGYLSMSSDGSERSPHPKLRRDKSKKMGSFMSSDSPMTATSYSQRTGKRNGTYRWNTGQLDWPGQKQYQSEQRHSTDNLGGSDLDEFRLRDASSAAQHAFRMAKLKREKAQKLLHRADAAMHKAMVALMTAEAIQAASEDTAGDT
ncbi:hypothetical protein Scep_008252 [Stephania cephalantha]|uniref:Enhancer of polycomb-like protein n=1 Tax=Stephania cephalantha TaxID=152367 RepID=A0AAP0KCL0_9MAGN